MALSIEEIAERSQALLLEWQLLRAEMKEYANSHINVVSAVDSNYCYKANYFPSDITPARIARVSNKIVFPK